MLLRDLYLSKKFVIVDLKIQSYTLIIWQFHYFRINGDRLAWIDVIKSNQFLDISKKIYICDLHFDPKDLIKNGKYLRPKKNILPRLM